MRMPSLWIMGTTTPSRGKWQQLYPPSAFINKPLLPAQRSSILTTVAEFPIGLGECFYKKTYRFYTERNTSLLFHLFMQSLVDSCMCPDWRSNLPSWCYWDAALPKKSVTMEEQWNFKKCLIQDMWSGIGRITPSHRGHPNAWSVGVDGT